MVIPRVIYGDLPGQYVEVKEEEEELEEEQEEREDEKEEWGKREYLVKKLLVTVRRRAMKGRSWQMINQKRRGKKNKH